MSNPAGPNSPVLYEADPSHAANMKQIRDRLNSICGSCLHRQVSIKTIDGHQYEGTVVHVDRGYLYLQCAVRDPRAFFAPSSAILPLVLYELLVITLML
ncbi:hypothetical protein [Paenibacillus protaetiae]|nr:hypothetical protein [Paenibacillus protaetiae]